MSAKSSLVAFGLTVILTSVVFLPLCGLLHRCGCRAPWAGGEARCNVHQPTGPHCPWCEHSALGGAAYFGTVLGQGLVFRSLRRRGRSSLGCGIAAAAALPIAVLAAGILAWLPTDYPHFLREDARSRLGLPEGPIRCGGGPPLACVHGPGPTGGR